MDDARWEKLCKAKEDRENTAKRLLQSLVGKTIKAVEIEHSGAEYNACIAITCTDNTSIRIETCQGDTYCFTDFYCKEGKPDGMERLQAHEETAKG